MVGIDINQSNLVASYKSEVLVLCEKVENEYGVESQIGPYYCRILGSVEGFYSSDFDYSRLL